MRLYIYYHYWLLSWLISSVIFTVGQDESQEHEMIKTNLDKGKLVVKSRFYGELFIYWT